MNTLDLSAARRTERYAHCIEISKRVCWDIEQDVIRGRRLDFTRKFLPDALARMPCFGFATPDEQRLIGQIQGRTYANTFALLERSLVPKMLEIGRGHALGDQLAAMSTVRVAEEELKHQELFRRIEAMMAAEMPAGYHFLPRANDFAGMVLARSTWAVLAFASHFEIASVQHFRDHMDEAQDCAELWKDVFRFHMREEAQHVIVDELEWEREDARLSDEQRGRAVGELLDLLGAMELMLQMQAAADAEYFLRTNARLLNGPDADQLRAGMLAAYRWQFVVSGAQNERFRHLLASLLPAQQVVRFANALEPLRQSC